MASEFELRIVHVPTGQTVVSWPPGRDDENTALDEIEALVFECGGVREALRQKLFSLKRQVT